MRGRSYSFPRTYFFPLSLRTIRTGVGRIKNKYSHRSTGITIRRDRAQHRNFHVFFVVVALLKPETRQSNDRVCGRRSCTNYETVENKITFDDNYNDYYCRGFVREPSTVVTTVRADNRGHNVRRAA